MSFSGASLQSLVDKDLYAQYLRRLDAQAVLDHYGAQNCREEYGRDGTREIIHSCLIDRVEPHHSHGDQNPSASCNLDKKLYVCYAGGWSGDLFHFVQKMENKHSMAETLPTVGEFLKGVTTEAVSLRKELEKVFAAPSAYHEALPAYSPRVLQPWSQPHPYWGRRGISELAQHTLHLGYDPVVKRIVFPHFVDGVLVGWQKRVIPRETLTDLDAKYKNSSGFPKSETLYNYDEASKYSIAAVVESPMSVARAISLGLPNVVSTFGAKVTDAHISLLKRFRTIYIWFDRDGAGIKGEKILLQGLYRHCIVKVIEPDYKKDMGDCTLGEIADKFSQAVPAALRLGQHDSWRPRWTSKT